MMPPGLLSNAPPRRQLGSHVLGEQVCGTLFLAWAKSYGRCLESCSVEYGKMSAENESCPVGFQGSTFQSHSFQVVVEQKFVQGRSKNDRLRLAEYSLNMFSKTSHFVRELVRSPWADTHKPGPQVSGLTLAQAFRWMRTAQKWCSPHLVSTARYLQSETVIGHECPRLDLGHWAETEIQCARIGVTDGSLVGFDRGFGKG
jgi:hypothetical protein